MSRARALTSLALTCALIAVPAAAAQADTACSGADTPAVAGSEAQLNRATLCLLNEQRAAAGLPALVENARLDQTATAYSQDMVAERFFDHTSPEGQTVVDRLTAVGYLPGSGQWAAGENIAWGQGSLATPRSIMNAWMNSEGHRENILSSNYSDIGLGVAMGTPTTSALAGATYTNDFGRHVADTTVVHAPDAHQAPSVDVTVHAEGQGEAKPKAKHRVKRHAKRRGRRCAARGPRFRAPRRTASPTASACAARRAPTSAAER